MLAIGGRKEDQGRQQVAEKTHASEQPDGGPVCGTTPCNLLTPVAHRWHASVTGAYPTAIATAALQGDCLGQPHLRHWIAEVAARFAPKGP